MNAEKSCGEFCNFRNVSMELIDNKCISFESLSLCPDEKYMRTWAPNKRYYIVYPRFIIDQSWYNLGKTWKAYVCNAEHKMLFDLTCDKYHSEIQPLFIEHKNETYIIYFPKFGEYIISDMSGNPMASLQNSHLIPNKLEQIDDNTLFLDTGIWYSTQYSYHINIQKTLETGKFSFQTDDVVCNDDKETEFGDDIQEEDIYIYDTLAYCKE